MADRKTVVYWGILLAAVLLIGLFICVAPTQSRFVRTAIWNTIALPGEKTITSDILRSDSDAPITVLMGEMTQENQKNNVAVQANFQLESEKGITGGLNWTVDKPEYLQVTMHVGATQLQQGGIVALAANDPVTVTVKMAATELAATQPHEAMRVKVDVSWGGILQGTFAVDLPEVASPEGATATEPQEPITDATEPQTEPVETEEPPVISDQSEVQIKTIRSFSKEISLPVVVTADNKTDKMELGLTAQDGTLTDFPAGTCYSLDQDAHCYLLYSGGRIRLDVKETQTVYLDFTRVQLQDTTLNLQLNTYQAGALHKSAKTSSVLSLDPVYQVDTQIMKDKEMLQIRLNPQWADYSVAYGLEKMTVVTTELGEYTQYMTIDPVLAGFAVTVTEGSAGDVITVTGGDPRPDAGNYVLCIQWSDGNMVFGQTRIPFFVNYYTEPQPQTEPATDTTTESTTEPATEPVTEPVTEPETQNQTETTGGAEQ